jgi:hypothetical protein
LHERGAVHRRRDQLSGRAVLGAAAIRSAPVDELRHQERAWLRGIGRGERRDGDPRLLRRVDRRLVVAALAVEPARAEGDRREADEERTGEERALDPREESEAPPPYERDRDPQQDRHRRHVERGDDALGERPGEGPRQQREEAAGEHRAGEARQRREQAHDEEHHAGSHQRHQQREGDAEEEHRCPEPFVTLGELEQEDDQRACEETPCASAKRVLPGRNRRLNSSCADNDVVCNSSR